MRTVAPRTHTRTSNLKAENTIQLKLQHETCARANVMKRWQRWKMTQRTRKNSCSNQDQMFNAVQWASQTANTLIHLHCVVLGERSSSWCCCRCLFCFRKECNALAAHHLVLARPNLYRQPASQSANTLPIFNSFFHSDFVHVGRKSELGRKGRKK